MFSSIQHCCCKFSRLWHECGVHWAKYIPCVWREHERLNFSCNREVCFEFARHCHSNGAHDICDCSLLQIPVYEGTQSLKLALNRHLTRVRISAFGRIFCLFFCVPSWAFWGCYFVDGTEGLQCCHFKYHNGLLALQLRHHRCCGHLLAKGTFWTHMAGHVEDKNVCRGV